MIPKLIHFVYGLKPKNTGSFWWVFYKAVATAKKHNPDCEIVLHYHYEPQGPWWDKTKELVTLNSIELPTHIGKKPIKKYAHAGDKIRMEVLLNEGGHYLDIDTVTVKPSSVFRSEETVLGYQCADTICNATMMTIPQSFFFKQWIAKYEEAFDPDGWSEASLLLPYKLWGQMPWAVKVLPRESWFLPRTATFFKEMFKGDKPLDPRIYSVHLWNNGGGGSIMKDIGPSYIEDHPNCLYAKILRQ